MATMMADHRSGRRGGHLRAVLRELRPGRDLSGATPRYVTLHEPDWSSDPTSRRGVQRQDQGDHQTRRTTRPGRSSRARSFETIAALCRKWDAIAILGQICDNIIYDGRRHPDGDDRGDGRSHDHAERAVEDYSVTGWRVGWTISAVADRADPQGARFPDGGAAARCCRRRGRLRSACPTTTTPGSPKATGSAATLLDILERHHFTCYKPFGALHHDRHQHVRLQRRHRVRALPGEGRGRGGRAGEQLLQTGAGRTKLRFCFCKKDETLQEADRRLQKLVPAGVTLH